MDQITNLHLTQDSLSNGGDLLLVEWRPVKRYVDGKPLENEYEFKCVVVAPKSGYSRFEITVSDKPAFEVPADGSVPVTFTGLTVKIYRKFNDNSTCYGLSCRAQSVMPKKA